jgi:hypothetical protein
MGIVAFRTAKHEVRLYRSEVKRIRRRERSYASRAGNGAAERQETIERRNCEDCLQLGIEAFRWLQKARQSYQDDVYGGHSEYDDDSERQITGLYETWLKPCAMAERWIVDLQQHGFPPGNISEFRNCCVDAAAVLEERRMAEVARRARLQSAGDED